MLDLSNAKALVFGTSLLSSLALGEPLKVLLERSKYKSSVIDDCKAVHGLVIEGTGTGAGSEGLMEKSFHRSAKKWAAAYAAFANDVTVVPPPIQYKGIKGPSSKHKDFADMMAAINDPNKICAPETAARFVDFVAQKNPNFVDKEQKPETELLNYGDGRIDTRLSVSKNVDMTQPDSLDKTGLLAKIKKMQDHCKGKSEQVVMVTIKDHGSANHEVSLGAGKRLSVDNVAQNIMAPLIKAGVKVVVNVDACYSGGFVDALKSKVRTGNCITSSTRSSTVGYVADPVIQRTFGQMYPHYLKTTGNPMKAQICASIWDPINAPKMDGGQVPGSSALARGVIPAEPATVAGPSALALGAIATAPAASIDRSKVLREIAGKYGFADIEKECAPPPYDKSLGMGLSEDLQKICGMPSTAGLV